MKICEVNLSPFSDYSVQCLTANKKNAELTKSGHNYKWELSKYHNVRVVHLKLIIKWKVVIPPSYMNVLLCYHWAKCKLTNIIKEKSQKRCETNDRIPVWSVESQKRLWWQIDLYQIRKQGETKKSTRDLLPGRT